MTPLGSPKDTHLPHPGMVPGVSWVNIVSSKSSLNSPDFPLHLQKSHFEKIKSSSHSSVTINSELWITTRDGMQFLLYPKFLSKSLPLDQAKRDLVDTWRGLGDFLVANLPNGYYFIHYATMEMHNKLLWEGPW